MTDSIDESVETDTPSPKLIPKQKSSPYNELLQTEEQQFSEETNRDYLEVSADKSESKVDMLSPNPQTISPNRPCMQLSPSELPSTSSFNLEDEQRP